MTLNQLGILHGTDKATEHPVGAHGYCPHYEQFLASLRESNVKMFEVGVGGGESIRMWLDFFPQASVVGVDIVSRTNIWNDPDSSPNPRYKFCQGDQSCKTFWACFMADFGSDWDFAADDGGHVSSQIITTFNAVWPHIKSGGFYAIEDLGVSYGVDSVFVPTGWQNHMDFVKDKLDDINRLDEIESLHFYKELAVFKKA